MERLAEVTESLSRRADDYSAGTAPRLRAANGRVKTTLHEWEVRALADADAHAGTAAVRVPSKKQPGGALLRP
jgi:hypothetical protein